MRRAPWPRERNGRAGGRAGRRGRELGLGITSGGARMTRFPREPNETPSSAPRRRARAIASVCGGPGRDRRTGRAVGDELDDRKQSAPAANLADHGVARGSFCRSENIVAPSARERSTTLVAVGVDRGDARRAGERMAAVREAAVEHLALDWRAIDALMTTAPAGTAAPVRPFASVHQVRTTASP